MLMIREGLWLLAEPATWMSLLAIPSLSAGAIFALLPGNATRLISLTRGSP